MTGGEPGTLVKVPRVTDALVLTCVDHRLHRWDHPYLADYLRGKRIGLAAWDLLTVPGACRDLVAADAGTRKEALLHAITTAHETHRIVQLLVVNHSDCAAYGGRSAFPDETEEYRKHAADLRSVREMLRSVLPNLDTRLFYAMVEERAEGPFVTFDEVR